ncbi:MAG: CRTAC1 family protein [Gammaproteobacteria bacterium]|nr:CRTAC1 family protein [Gammaproteobacteria bacterium]
MNKTNQDAPAVQDDGEEHQQDDAIIARFFWRSMQVLIIGGVLVAIGVWWAQRQPVVESVEEHQQTGPQILQSSDEPQPPDVDFVNVTAEAGIDFVHTNGAYGDKLLPETMGGGVALFDYDNDGNIDVLFIDSASWPWHDEPQGGQHHLYRNLGNWTFSDETATAGLRDAAYGMGVAIGDYDGDGYRDVYVTNLGANVLYRNLGGNSFAAVDAGVAGSKDAWSTSAAFFDMDNDGDLDLFVCNYVEWSRDIDFEVDYRLTGIGRAYGPPTNYAGTQSYLFRNDGGSFTDVSAEAGIFVENPATGLPVGKALAVRPADVNQDGLLDLVVANDTVQNFVFMNLGEGRFEERGALMGMAFDNSGNATGAMGVDAVNYTNDEQLAVVIANFANEMSSFYVGSAQDIFTDESNVSGIGPDSRRALSFGLFFFDYDLDGRADLLTANGHVEDDINVVQPSQQHAQSAQLFWNCGMACRRTFKPVATIGDLGEPLVGRGAAFADMDNDGDTDVVITQTGRPAALFRNGQVLDHHWLQVQLTQENGNRDAIGAVVEVETGTRSQRRQIMPARSYLSQVPSVAYFGLGDEAEAVRVTVTWPDGKTSVYEELEVDQRHTLAP